MRPPPDQSLDIRGTRTDLPARAQPQYGVGMLHDLRGRDRARAALDHAGLAVHPLLRQVDDAPLDAGDPQLHLVVPVGADGAGGDLAVAALPGRAGRPVAGRRRPHPGRDRVLVHAHRRHAGRALVAGPLLGAGLRLVGAGGAGGVSLPRLGDDDLLGHRRPQSRAALLPRVARARGARRAARDQAGGGAAHRRCSSSCIRISCSTRCTRSRR